MRYLKKTLQSCDERKQGSETAEEKERNEERKRTSKDSVKHVWKEARRREITNGTRKKEEKGVGKL